METYFRKWEKENLNQLIQIGEEVRALGDRLWRKLSLILFVLYIALRVALQLSLALFQAPRMVRQVGPGLRPLERDEFDKRDRVLTIWGGQR